MTGLDVGTDDRLAAVVLADGRSVACRALVVGPRFTARSGVLTGLGLPEATIERDGRVVGTCVDSDPQTGATALPGVWAAGNVTSPMEQVAGAAAQGVRAAVAINTDLIEEETRRALRAGRGDAADLCRALAGRHDAPVATTHRFRAHRFRAHLFRSFA